MAIMRPIQTVRLIAFILYKVDTLTVEEIKVEHQSVMCSGATSVETKQIFENYYCRDFLLSILRLHVGLRSGYKLERSNPNHTSSIVYM